jgi:hypothetical protein
MHYVAVSDPDVRVDMETFLNTVVPEVRVGDNAEVSSAYEAQGRLRLCHVVAVLQRTGQYCRGRLHRGLIRFCLLRGSMLCWHCSHVWA